MSSDSFFILNVAGGDDSDLRSECRGVLYSNMYYVERSRFRIPMCWCQCRCPLFATVRSSSVIFVLLGVAWVRSTDFRSRCVYSFPLTAKFFFRLICFGSDTSSFLHRILIYACTTRFNCYPCTFLAAICPLLTFLFTIFSQSASHLPSSVQFWRHSLGCDNA